MREESMKNENTKKQLVLIRSSQRTSNALATTALQMNQYLRNFSVVERTNYSTLTFNGGKKLCR